MKKFISLLSGGLDSPIASLLMIEKGFRPIFISFLTSDDIDQSMRQKVLKLIEFLKKITKEKIKIYLINHDPNLNLFKQVCERKLTCILCKRLMIRIAKQIAREEGTNIIVTGDILGEQASQTLDNLHIYNDLLENFIILRPLIAWNKQDVIDLNRKKGLYEILSQTSASCQFNPPYPETHAKSIEVLKSESKVDINLLVIQSLERAESLIF
jgi:thiamine biosynthesis protein ThiI